MARGMYLVSSLFEVCDQRRLLAHLSPVSNLVKEDVLAIPTLGRKILQVTILIDTMLLT